ADLADVRPSRLHRRRGGALPQGAAGRPVGRRLTPGAMPHRSRLAGFIIDCNVDDLDAAAAFWSGALGSTIADPDAGDGGVEYQMFGKTPGDLHVEVQKVDHPSRVHLDIEADDIEAEAARLEALGARKVAFVKRWWVMEAPTGQRFCVVRMRDPEKGATPNEWP